MPITPDRCPRCYTRYAARAEVAEPLATGRGIVTLRCTWKRRGAGHCGHPYAIVLDSRGVRYVPAPLTDPTFESLTATLALTEVA